MSTKRNAILLAAALALGPATVAAQDWFPLPRDFNGIRVITGGVTIEESTAMKQMAGHYRLRLVLANRVGDYQVAKDLRITQWGRTLVTLPEAGPWVLADLPQGRYQLFAEVNGELLEKTVVLGPKSGTVHWVTPARLD